MESDEPPNDSPAASVLPAGQSGPGELDSYRNLVESALQRACDFGLGCPPRLADAIRYALLAPGKRLRPILVLMAAQACRGDENGLSESSAQAVLPGAVAVEMIHAYSLIHDDLPAMDDDDLRRGRPTVHIEYDEATAILAGDALQSEAFRHLATQVTDPVQAVQAIRTLASASAAAALVGGQVDDLLAEDDPMSVQPRSKGDDHDLNEDMDASLNASSEKAALLNRLESIHLRKTGALIAASLDLGAILVGASQEARDALARYATHLGLAFQVVDDNLDFTADTQTLGKRSGKDADRGKLTYPGLLGLEASRERARGLVEAAKREALFFGASSQRLCWLADYVLERTH